MTVSEPTTVSHRSLPESPLFLWCILWLCLCIDMCLCARGSQGLMTGLSPNLWLTDVVTACLVSSRDPSVSTPSPRIGITGEHCHASFLNGFWESKLRFLCLQQQMFHPPSHLHMPRILAVVFLVPLDSIIQMVSPLLMSSGLCLFIPSSPPTAALTDLIVPWFC